MADRPPAAHTTLVPPQRPDPRQDRHPAEGLPPGDITSMTTKTIMPANNDGSNIPRALRDGILRFGEIEVPCYVLPDGIALLTARGMTNIFAPGSKGDLRQLVGRIVGSLGESAAAKGANSPPSALENVSDSRVFSLPSEVRFRPPRNNVVATGYPGDVLIDICTLYTRALAAGTLHPKQVPLAARAAVIVTACAKTGITAAIWEATGYDKVKAAGALQDKLAATLRHEAGQWERLFSPEFFNELAKLFRLKLGPDGRRPMAFAGFLAEFFYEWFDRDVYTAVKTKNPRLPALGGEREHCHHQFLTSFARERFARHQRDVLILMRASTSLDDFRMRFDAAFRGGGLQLSFGTA